MRSTSASLLVAVLVLGAVGSARAQGDLDELFSNDRFYAEHHILQSRSDVAFLGDLWSIPATADSTRELIGVTLSNSDLQFVRTDQGGWQARYAVRVTFRRGDEEVFDQTWDKSVGVETFDETSLTGETIVFQAETRLAPGDYTAAVVVKDLNADALSRVERDVTVPGLRTDRPTLATPVLLRLYRAGAGGDVDYVVHPSHYYPSAPDGVDFMATADVPAGSGPWSLSARLEPLEEDTGETVPAWSDTVSPGPDGRIRAFATIPNREPRFGEYTLELTLADPSGAVADSASTPVMIAGSSGWIIDHWDRALSLIRYEATPKERDILKDVKDPKKRIEAWNCFWQIRDPVPSTSSNEALQEYFRKIRVADENWTSSLRPGYLSDRGRVFITLGPPDDISRQPMPAYQKPFEIWTYQRYNFQIVFVDRIGFNNYQIWDESLGTYQRELSVIERRKRQFLRERANQCPLLAPAFD